LNATISVSFTTALYASKAAKTPMALLAFHAASNWLKLT
jgi:hypothetical protein